MRLSKAGYYADFIVYPPAVAALAAVTLGRAPFHAWIEWTAECLAGILVWTFLEYLIHRFVFHHVGMFADMHAVHHQDPTGHVGTPTWVSLAVGLGTLLPLWWLLGFDVAGALLAGLMIGYFWYVTLHHINHHWQPRPGSYLHAVKRRHALHHYAPVPCNFGVTTGLWDHVFGTAHPSRRRAGAMVPTTGARSPLRDSE
jgi:sterol desaturase/sphingolipid hydroxylase (fatty acid hydroxylase superfamily)